MEQARLLGYLRRHGAGRLVGSKYEMAWSGQGTGSLRWRMEQKGWWALGGGMDASKLVGSLRWHGAG